MRNYAPRWPFALNRDHAAAEGLMSLWLPVPGEWRDLAKRRNATYIGTKRPFYPSRHGGRVFRSAADNDAMDLGDYGVLGYNSGSGNTGATIACCVTPQSAASGAWAGIMVARGGVGLNGFQRNNNLQQLVESQNYTATPLAFNDQARQVMGVRYEVSSGTPYSQTKFTVERGKWATSVGTQSVVQYIYFDDMELARDDNATTRTMRGEYEWAGVWKRPVQTDILTRLEHPAGFAELLHELGRRTVFLAPAVAPGGFSAAWARNANSVISAGVRAA